MHFCLKHFTFSFNFQLTISFLFIIWKLWMKTNLFFCIRYTTHQWKEKKEKLMLKMLFLKGWTQQMQKTCPTQNWSLLLVSVLSCLIPWKNCKLKKTSWKRDLERKYPTCNRKENWERKKRKSYNSYKENTWMQHLRQRNLLLFSWK